MRFLGKTELRRHVVETPRNRFHLAAMMKALTNAAGQSPLSLWRGRDEPGPVGKLEPVPDPGALGPREASRGTPFLPTVCGAKGGSGVREQRPGAWFEELLEELGCEIWIGHATAIRLFARRRQKNDRRKPG
jgi:hypothetical protein